jgi:hypothetical protein
MWVLTCLFCGLAEAENTGIGPQIAGLLTTIKTISLLRVTEEFCLLSLCLCLYLVPLSVSVSCLSVFVSCLCLCLCLSATVSQLHLALLSGIAGDCDDDQNSRGSKYSISAEPKLNRRALAALNLAGNGKHPCLPVLVLCPNLLSEYEE